MRVPVSWLREYVSLPADLTAERLAARLTAFDLKLEKLIRTGEGLRGPLVVARVLSFESEDHSNGRTVRWCQVDVGAEHGVDGGPRGVVCGAHNFAVGDLVVAVLPGAVLPEAGDEPMQISARRTYGHVSDGMLCSARELGLGDDRDGILVLPPGSAEVGADAIELLGLRDVVLDLEVNPDRAYALSLRGVGRDTAIAHRAAFRDPAALPPGDTDESVESYPVRVEALDGCPVFAARTVSGFDPSRSTPRLIARRLQLAGMRSISLAVDVTNYVMLELGQPIHGYDRGRLSGPIGVRRAEAGEKLATLDGVVRDLAAGDLLITDDSGPIGLAGVMGGEHTELGAGTTDIVVEAAYFEPTGIARTSRRHKLGSEASRRFERGVDPTLPAVATRRVAELLVEHGGGRVDDGLTLVGVPPDRPAIELPVGLASRVTGVKVAPDVVVEALALNGCDVEVGAGTDDALAVRPPPWRPDLSDPYDLVEEVIRVVGYDQVPSVLPTAPAGRGLTVGQRLRRRVSTALAGAGFVELKSFPFVGPTDFDLLGLPADDPRRAAVVLENPMSAQEPALTTTLLPLLLRGARVNVSRGQPDLAVFEVGPVFLATAGLGAAPVLPVTTRPSEEDVAALDAALPRQPRHLGVLLTGDRAPAGWSGPGRAVTWADSVAAVREVARVLSVELEVHTATREPWHPGRCAQLEVGGVVVGFAGELHPRVATAYGLPARPSAAEVDLDAMIALAPPIVRPAPLSDFPVAKEDVALLVDASVPGAAVAAALQEGGGELLESVRLFDVYTGPPVLAGQKSLAFALRMRAPDRTLTETETSRVRADAVAAAAAATGAVQRG